jgi:hypothetical protein
MEPVSLQQGYHFNSRNRYEPKRVTREFFENLTTSTASSPSTSATKCNPHRVETFLEALIKKYEGIVSEIKDLETAYKNQTSNLYLNKNVKFSDGTYAYVTNSGILKKYSGLDMLQKNANLNGCPPPAFVTVSIPWSSDYDTPGASVNMPAGTNNPRGVTLKVGSPMVAGQSCGYEGSDVMVSQENDTPSSRYIGCYDNPAGSYPAASYYVDGVEPYTNYIVNGNFALPASNQTAVSIKITPGSNVVQNWSTTSSALLLVASLNTTQNTIPTPYPENAPTCVSMQGTQNISQTINTTLQPGSYTLSFDACGFSTSNPIYIAFNGVSIFAGNNFLVPTMSWKNYQYVYNLQAQTTSLTVTFSGTDTSASSTMYSAITNVRFTNGTMNTVGTQTFAQCQSAAKTSGSPYFGFQASSANDGTGFCFMNTDTSGTFLSSLTTSNAIGQSTILSSGTATPPQKGVAAGVTNTGLLVVYTSLNKSRFVQVSTNNGIPNKPNNKIYLIMSNDGRARIYTGGDPTSTTPGTLLWISSTPKVQPVPNPEYEATKGHNGVSYLKPTDSLSPGQWVGSPDGSVYLKMESDGNLNLYASSFESVCKKSSTGNNMEGSASTAAMYKTNTASDNFFTNLGKVFNISPDSVMQSYQSSSVALSNNYEKISNYNNPGTSFDLQGDFTSYKTAKACRDACSVRNDCYGYAFTPSSATCQLKGSSITGDVGGDPVNGTDLYIRQQKLTPKLKEGFDQMQKNFNKIGSTQQQNYVKGASIQYSPDMSPDVTIDDKRRELSQVQEEIDSAIQELTQCHPFHPINPINPPNPYNPFNPPPNPNQPDMKDLFKEIAKYKAIINNWNTGGGGGGGGSGGDNGSTSSTSLDNIVEDTSLKVVQESNTYMVWGLVAAASALIAIGASKL